MQILWFNCLFDLSFKYALPETDIAPENRPSQKETTSIPTIHFQVFQQAVSFREGK